MAQVMTTFDVSCLVFRCFFAFFIQRRYPGNNFIFYSGVLASSVCSYFYIHQSIPSCPTGLAKDLANHLDYLSGSLPWGFFYLLSFCLAVTLFYLHLFLGRAGFVEKHHRLYPFVQRNFLDGSVYITPPSRDILAFFLCHFLFFSGNRCWSQQVPGGFFLDAHVHQSPSCVCLSHIC